MNLLDRDYQSLLIDILHNGVKKSDRTGTGTISVFGRQIRHKMSDGFPLLTTKKMAWKQIVTELLWFLRGEVNIQPLVQQGNYIWVGDAYKKFASKVHQRWEDGEINELYESGCLKVIKDLDSQIPHETIYGLISKSEFIELIKTNDQFAQEWGDLGPIYGKQWRNWQGFSHGWHDVAQVIDGIKGHEPYLKGIDQIQNAIDTLKNNPDSRRNIVSAWNVGEIDQMTLPPCHNFFQFYTRELSLDERMKICGEMGYDGSYKGHDICDELFVPKRSISLMWNQRSVDTFLGLPFNIASYGLLLEIIAKEVNMIPDELIGNLGDTHLYNNHIDQVKEQLDREDYELPKLNIKLHFNNNPSFVPEQWLHTDFELENYQSHSAIKAPLSN